MCETQTVFLSRVQGCERTKSLENKNVLIEGLKVKHGFEEKKCDDECGC